MIKLTGVILIIISGAMTGLYFSARLSKRVEFCEDYIALINETNTKVRYTLAPLNIIFSNMRYGDGIAFIMDNVQSKINSGMSFIDAFEKSLTDAQLKKQITESDKSYLSDFAKGLCENDLEGIESHCKLSLNSAKTMLNKALKEKQEKSKMYKSLGLLGGIAISLFII